MAYDFPDSPTNGQVFTPAGGSMSWTFDDGKWKISIGAKVTISTSSPTGGSDGDIWLVVGT